MPKIIDKRMKKIADVTQLYGEDYTNQHGKITPYHILFKDFGDEIGSMKKDEAVQFVTDKINELQSNYNGDPNYIELIDEDVNTFLADCQQTRDGMGVLFVIKDYLIKTEDEGIVASLDVILKNPKTANKVASVINGLLKAHNLAIESRKNKNK